MAENDSIPETALPTAAPNTESYDEAFDGVELHTPLHLNELLYDISSYFNAAVLDLTDGIVQAKAVVSSFENEELWQDEDIKKAALLSSLGDIESFCKDSELGDENLNYTTYLEDVSTNLYNCFYDFSEYAYGLEYVIALIETTLKNADPDNYDEMIASIIGTSSVNELGHLAEDLSAGKIAGVGLGRAGAFIGPYMTPAGIAALDAFGEGGIGEVLKLPHGQMLKDAITNFLQGNPIPGGGGKVPTFGSKLLSGIGTAAIFFALGVGYDALTGNFSWENVAVRGAKAGVAVISSMAGSLVTSALSGTAAGSWAGPIGMAVGCVIAVVGNIIIDAINHNAHYTSNELPRDYTPITVDYVREQMKKNGYATGVLMAGDETYYDAVSSLLCSTDNDEFISYLIQKGGNNTVLTPPSEMSTEQLNRYDDMVYYLRSNPRASDEDIQFIFGYLNDKELSFINTYRETIGDNLEKFDAISGYLGKTWFEGSYDRPHPARLFQAIPPEAKESMGLPYDQPHPPTPEPTPQSYYDTNGIPLSETPPPPTTTPAPPATPIPPGA